MKPAMPRGASAPLGYLKGWTRPAQLEENDSMVERDAILQQTLLCLSPHCHPEWGDRTPLDVFNRLVAKNLRPAEWTPNTHLEIQESQISSRLEYWTTAALARVERAHPGVADRDSASPIILVEYAGALRLIDGNHRINRWVMQLDVREHQVNIHSINGMGQFIERPNAARSA